MALGLQNHEKLRRIIRNPGPFGWHVVSPGPARRQSHPRTWLVWGYNPTYGSYQVCETTRVYPKLVSLPHVINNMLIYTPLFDQRSIETQAAVFKGEPFCMFGDCAICLRLGKGLFGLGISAPCPLGANAAMAHLGAAPNPNNCKAYRFQEINCLKALTATA